MFFHNIKYELLSSIREKGVVIWLIIFPIILGTLFKTAFSGIYEKTEVYSTIPVAVVENEQNEVFRSVIDTIESADKPLLKVTFTDAEEARELLKAKEVEGIIYVDEEISLGVAEQGIEETILKAFTEQYAVQERIITDTIKSDPARLEAVVSALTSEAECNRDIPLTDGNTDIYIGYFYNLIAMVAMYGSITGLHISIGNQGNLSALGARKCCSPTPKSISLLASLLGSFVIQSLCMVICVTYLAFILKVDFGSRLPQVYISSLIGGFLGVALGFMIGSIGRMSQGAKVGIAMAVSMTSCFMSGLMVANIKPLMAEKAPWFNKINPATVISDSFYCLNVYNDYGRFTEKIVTMLILTAVFMAIGFLLTRRRKYASL